MLKRRGEPSSIEGSKSLSSRKYSSRWGAISIVSVLIALSSWAITSPVGSSPDDDYHLVSIWCGQGFRDGLCEQGSEPGQVLVRETLKSNSFCFASQPLESGFCPETDSRGETTRTNGGENPRIFYWVNSWLASDQIVASVISIRIFNATLIILALALVLVFLPTHLRRVSVIGVLMTSLPLGLFIIPSTNPSSWGFGAILVFFSAFVGFLATSSRRDRIALGVLSFLSVLMAAGSRPDSALYVGIAMSVAFILTMSRKLLKPVNLGFSALLIALTGFFFLSAGNTSATVSGAPGGNLTVATLGSTLLNFVTLPDLWVGAFGGWGLGWLDTPLPSSVWALTYGMYFALLFASIRFFDIRQMIATSLVFVSLIAVPIAALTASGLVVGQFVQPRYLLPLLGLLLAAAMYRYSSSCGLELTRGQVWPIGLVFVGANAIAMHINLRRYLTGMDGNKLSLEHEIEWWWVERPFPGAVLWLSPNYVWVVGSLAFGLFLVSLWKLRRELGLPGTTPSQSHQSVSSEDLQYQNEKTKEVEVPKSFFRRKN